MKSSSIKTIKRLQDWMDSIAGKTFLNYAYSWGAAIVILGALFKLTHLPLANIMLFIGMGTEVFVFFISAFDRPFDITEAEELDDDNETSEGAVQTAGALGGGTIIIGGNGNSADATGSIPEGGVATGGGNITFASSNGNAIIDTAQAAANPEIEEVSHEYVEKLKVLTETLENVEKQLAKLTTDSEEMTNLNRTLTGINTVYELQLKGVSQQVGSIEQINEQTRRMAQQIEELNGMYARMIQALTINMKNASNQVGI